MFAGGFNENKYAIPRLEEAFDSGHHPVQIKAPTQQS